MLTYGLRRLGHAVLVLWITFTAGFLLLLWLPGDAALSKAVGGDSGGSANVAATVARLRHELGYDKPVLVQYLDTLVNDLHGKFGVSIETGQPVWSIFAQNLPSTLELAGCALVVGSAGGILLGVLAVAVRQRAVQEFLTFVMSIGVSVPAFWIGLVALEFVSFRWHLLPAFGASPATLILPVLVLAVPTSAHTAQLLVASLKRTLREPFIEIARAKGAGWLTVLFTHALRYSVFPVVTALGVTAGTLISGTVVMEQVFSRPGVGSVLLRAVSYQDTPVVLFTLLFTATVFVTINFIVDLCYPFLDRRVDIGTRRAGRLRARTAAA